MQLYSTVCSVGIPSSVPLALRIDGDARLFAMALSPLAAPSTSIEAIANGASVRGLPAAD